MFEVKEVLESNRGKLQLSEIFWGLNEWGMHVRWGINGKEKKISKKLFFRVVPSHRKVVFRMWAKQRAFWITAYQLHSDRQKCFCKRGRRLIDSVSALHASFMCTTSRSIRPPLRSAICHRGLLVSRPAANSRWESANTSRKKERKKQIRLVPVLGEASAFGNCDLKLLVEEFFFLVEGGLVVDFRDSTRLFVLSVSLYLFSVSTSDLWGR